jgi:hypothetical protein
MWEKPVKKCIFTVAVDGYNKEITNITFPLIYAYAQKIKAEFRIIKDRKFPGWPPVYEKLQIYRLAQEMGNDWNIFIDADALVRPPMMPDLTSVLNKRTVLHNGSDHAPIRWAYDRFFLRDGRHIGSCNWFAMASDWNIELWEPLSDLTLEEAAARISLTPNELACGFMKPEHLIDDFTLSRNIAKYKMEFTTFIDIQKQLGGMIDCLWHIYAVPEELKIIEIRKQLKKWGM